MRSPNSSPLTDRAVQPALVSISSVKKLLSVVVVAALAIGGVTLCFPDSPSNAATVGSEHVTRASLNADLAAIAASPGFTCYVNAALVESGSSNTRGIVGQTPGSYNPVYAAYWLTQRMSGIAAWQYVGSHHLEVTPKDLIAAKTSFETSISQVLAQAASSGGGCSQSTEQIVASMPASFIARQVGIQAAFEAVLRSQGAPTSPAAIRSYFDANPARFDTICLSAIVASASSINQAVSALRQGMPFAQAVKLFSQSGSNSNGSIGCFAPSGANYAQVSSIVGSAGVGQLVPPFAASSTLFALLRVDARIPNAFASVKNLVATVARASSQAAATASIRNQLSSDTVIVNSSYGTWTNTQSQLKVTPPTVPA